MEDLRNKISIIKANYGGDDLEDWGGGFKIALNNMNCKKGIKSIIHIEDSFSHGKEF
jgi:hypothetical protein